MADEENQALISERKKNYICRVLMGCIQFLVVSAVIGSVIYIIATLPRHNYYLGHQTSITCNCFSSLRIDNGYYVTATCYIEMPEQQLLNVFSDKYLASGANFYAMQMAVSSFIRDECPSATDKWYRTDLLERNCTIVVPAG